MKPVRRKHKRALQRVEAIQHAEMRASAKRFC